MNLKYEDTIIAQCTPEGPGALALIRLSGKDAFSIASSLSKIKNKSKSDFCLIEAESHTVHYGWVINSKDQPIDQVLFIVMRGPRTFTGEDTVEITCHNNVFIIEEIINEAIKHGARIAQPGEFTRRALENEKIDLVQAEAVQELIFANTQLTLKKSLSQLEGSFSAWSLQTEKKLLQAVSFCEASFEFLDEEHSFSTIIKEILLNLREQLKVMNQNFKYQQQVRQGIRVALIGSVNAGKSSIFNQLVGYNRAIITDQAGTTRDVLEVGLYKQGNYWTIIDTAGIRQTEDIIEKEGISRSRAEAHKADIILLIFDGSTPLTKQEEVVYQEFIENYKDKIIIIRNKIDINYIDIASINIKEAIHVSGLTGAGIKELEEKLTEKINLLFQKLDSPFLLNKRQSKLLITLEQKIEIILALLDNFVHYELVSYHLREALEQIAELTGKSVSEAALDMVFKEFCVGK